MHKASVLNFLGVCYGKNADRAWDSARDSSPSWLLTLGQGEECCGRAMKQIP